jgi:hypothetical protein
MALWASWLPGSGAGTLLDATRKRSAAGAEGDAKAAPQGSA